MPGNIGKTRKVGSATGVSASRNLDAPSKVERVSFLDVLDQKDDERRKKNLDELLRHVDELAARPVRAESVHAELVAQLRLVLGVVLPARLRNNVFLEAKNSRK